MSDNQKTPGKTARVNSERFDTELEAVWYAANYYNKASYQHLGEYIGVVFRENYGQHKYGITVRGDGDFFQSKVSIGDVPRGTLPVAVWHTHVPSCAAKDPFTQLLLYLFTTGDAAWDEFSDTDRTLADKATKTAQKLFHHGIAIYMVTPTVIKRYRPGARHPEQAWQKQPPHRMYSGPSSGECASETSTPATEKVPAPKKAPRNDKIPIAPLM